MDKSPEKINKDSNYITKIAHKSVFKFNFLTNNYQNRKISITVNTDGKGLFHLYPVHRFHSTYSNLRRKYNYNSNQKQIFSDLIKITKIFAIDIFIRISLSENNNNFNTNNLRIEWRTKKFYNIIKQNIFTSLKKIMQKRDIFELDKTYDGALNNIYSRISNINDNSIETKLEEILNTQKMILNIQNANMQNNISSLSSKFSNYVH